MKNLLIPLALFSFLLVFSCSKDEDSGLDADLKTYNMILVKGGSFSMGCTSDAGYECLPDEKPAHNVTLSDFYISKYEVTQELWTDIMGEEMSYFDNCDQCPVERVSWENIQEFLIKLNEKTGKNYRLPTEAEWEYAARGGAEGGYSNYSGGDEVGKVAWYYDNSDNKTHPVGQKAPNKLGLYDMSGNVWEWCQDRYGPYSSSPQTDPQGPDFGDYRVLRGGSSYVSKNDCRVTNRYGIPTDWYYSLGFRLARD